jgi:hypothetical protein
MAFLAGVMAFGCTPSDSELSMLLEEAAVTLPSFDSVAVQLQSGRGEVELDDGTIVLRATLTDWRAIVDIDGDGSPDAVAVVMSHAGGTGTFMELAVFALNGRRWIWRGSVSLGDRVSVRVLAVEGDTVLVRMVTHGPEDPMCCPTFQEERRFRLGPGGLERVGELR